MAKTTQPTLISPKMNPPTTTTTTISVMIICIITTLSSSSSITAVDPSTQDFVEAHNQARAAVGVPPLAWNDTVADYAMQYAKKRFPDCKLEHSGGPYGENLAEGYGRLSAVDAVGMWVSEKSCYDHKSNTCVGGECLHYTQVVWKHSVNLGCARLKCRNDWLFVICNYYPPGNYIGETPY